jgi:REP element-mobilizing transposase RayT
MARPLRLEFPGALYHITARGDRQEPIFEDDSDRLTFLDLLGKEVVQQGWLLYAFCLMGNHYHLLLETPEPNLVRGMRRLNGVYTQRFNRRHGRVGHVLQGRYKSILVDKDVWLSELCRYVVLNPVRAHRVKDPGDWPWSSYRSTAGLAACPDWLAADLVLELFSATPGRARAAYRHFVAEGSGVPRPWDQLSGQIFLGDAKFLDNMARRASEVSQRAVPRRQLRPGRPGAAAIVRAVADAHGIPQARVLDRSNPEAFKHAVYLLRRVGNLPLNEVAQRAGISIGRVSQIQTEMESGQPDARLQEVLRRL